MYSSCVCCLFCSMWLIGSPREIQRTPTGLTKFLPTRQANAEIRFSFVSVPIRLLSAAQTPLVPTCPEFGLLAAFNPILERMRFGNLEFSSTPPAKGTFLLF